MSEGGGGVGGSDEVEGALSGGIFEGDEGVVEGVEAVGYSIMDVAVEVGGAYKSMNNLGAAHLIKLYEWRIN